MPRSIYEKITIIFFFSLNDCAFITAIENDAWLLIYIVYLYSVCSPRIPQWSDIDWSSGYVALYAQGRVSEALVILSCISLP